jgi:hypothetical protein
MTNRVRVLRAAAIILVFGVLVAACASPSQPSGSSGSGCGTTASELQYGCGPTSTESVTYQPNVVTVAGGAEAVRSRSSDGMTWTIKGDAPGADQLEPGKIMLVTGLGVGEVLAVQPSGNDRQVILGPVNLTDVIRDADVASDRPISFSNPLYYSAPSLVGASADLETSPSPSPSPSPTADVVALPALELAAATEPAPMPPPSREPQEVGVGAFKELVPICCNGFGLRFTYDAGGVRVQGSVILHFTAPSAKFQLLIRGGKLISAGLQLSGVGGLFVDFKAATESGAAGNINKLIQVPIEVSIPVAGIGIPFSVKLTNWFTLKTTFTAKDSSLDASGDFSFAGTVGFGYQNGGLSPSVPQGFSVNKSLVSSITGFSIGVARIDMTYQARFCICIGAFGFSAGIYAYLTPAIAVVNGSSAGAFVVRCHGARLSLAVVIGVGYSIPQVVADLVNLFLKVFKARPIAASGGPSKRIPIFTKDETDPANTPACGTG